MAQKTHAIIGTGVTSKKALFQALEEVVKDGDAVSLVWGGAPNETVELAYDYVLDNEIEFTMFYEDGKQPPKVFRVSDTGVTQKSRNPLVAAAKSVADGGKVLILWDDDEQDDYVNAGDAVESGTLFLDLSNGLAPIVFEDEDEEEIEEVEEVEEVEEEEEVETFTRDELFNMPAAAVKRYGSAKGAKAATKGGIIDELFPEEEEEEEHDADVGHAPLKEEAPKPDFPKHSNEEDQWVRLERSLTNITPDADAIAAIEVLRDSFKETGRMILETGSFGRERALAITKLEEAAMWAIKGIVLSTEVK